MLIAARVENLAMKAKALALVALACAAVMTTHAEQCGRQAGGAVCPNNFCCSQWGFCGLGGDYCGTGCQSGPCNGATLGAGVAAVVTRVLFNKMLPHRDDPACPARGFYTYDAFVAAAGAFPAFGTIGDDDARRREVAAFLAQTSHETSGDSYSLGYCNKEVKGATSDYCVPTVQWPCAPGKKYHARGPMQITYNYNYGPVGRAIGADLLANPDLVATDPAVAFKTALWLWMTPRSPEQPSCHDVVTGRWSPTAADRAASRVPGYGLTTNILTGGFECARGSTGGGRVRFYKRYCDILGVSYGPDLDCDYQDPYDGAIKSLAQ